MKGSEIGDVIALLRPAQWVKNAFVVAPLVFSQRFFRTEDLVNASLALASFCMVSSAAYVFNDIMDRDRDRNHPLKSKRPIAAGRLGTGIASVLTVFLIVASILLGIAIAADFVVVLLAFLVLQVAYTLGLKSVVVADVVAIAAGFVLRAAAGVLAVGATMSSWLFVCTFLLAMFLALGKRRHEMTMLEGRAGEHREVLGRYTVRLLDQLVAIVSVSTIVVYALYTVTPEVVDKLGAERLYLTVPFVVFGVFRYLFLIYGREGGGNPTDVLLEDAPLQIGIALWIVTVFLLLYR